MSRSLRPRPASLRRSPSTLRSIATAGRRRVPLTLAIVALGGSLLTGCGGPAAADAGASTDDPDLQPSVSAPDDPDLEPDVTAPDDPAPEPDVTASDDPDLEPDVTAPEDPAPTSDGDAAPTGRLDVEVDGTELRVVDASGTRVLGWTLPASQGEVFRSVLSRPGVADGEVDAVVVTIRGEVPRLSHLRVLRGEDGALLPFPAHLQPQSEMESVISVSWTPDGRSLLWTEPTGDGVTLRTVGWDGGPGTGRTADDNASFALDLPADVTVDGTVVEADGRWTVSLLDGVGGWHELTLERQADGALALVS